jgi:cardiolipin synthase (CMP-forming)
MKQTKKLGALNQKVQMTLANQITIGRIVFIPVIVILLIKQQMRWAFVLLTISVLSDLADGLAARLRGEQTQLGAFLDPLADKFLLTSVYLTLTAMRVIDVWVFVVIFSRDLLIVLGWCVIYILTGSSKIVPRPLGKVTTAVQMAAAMAIVLPAPHFVGSMLIWALVLFSVLSVGDYIWIGEKRLGQWN